MYRASVVCFLLSVCAVTQTGLWAQEPVSPRPPTYRVLGQPRPAQPAPQPLVPVATPPPAPPTFKAAVTSTETPPPAFLPRLDSGLLDQKWFADTAIPWEKRNICADFFWAKPGLTLKDQNLSIRWESPTILSGETDEWDNSVAHELRYYMPEQLTLAISPVLPVVSADPKFKLIGRTVECNVCSSYMSASAEVHTFDMKLVDATSGELVMAQPLAIQN